MTELTDTLADIDHLRRLAWLRGYCAGAGLTLDLEGEVGFGRECVGILIDGEYVDYDAYAPEGEGTGPGEDAPHAYHKHGCLAVLGRGTAAETELHDWVRRIVEAGAVVRRDVPKEIPDVGAVFFGRGARNVFVMPSRITADLSYEASPLRSEVDDR